VAEVTMSVEEYRALLEQIHGDLPKVAFEPQLRGGGSLVKKKKRVGKKDPKMARALKKANAMGRKKAGGFKKGWSQGKIMRKAHQLRRKM
jgi:hypothetical protein